MSATERIAPDLVICRLGQVVSPAGQGAPLRGAELGEVELIEGDVWIAVEGERIAAVGQGYEVRPRLDVHDGTQVIDAEGMVAIPGLVDCHTHACFAGDRVAEFEMRARGAGYEELHAAGGGILSTVRATREAGVDDLDTNLDRHVGWMLAHGTTTLEVKSGYGLEVEAELRMLRAARSVAVLASPRVLTTVLAPHAVPPELDGDAWIDVCIEKLLPEVVDWELASAADVFVERGAFDVAQARRWLEAARERGLDLRLHGDQFSEMGAVELAIELDARSVDHLEATGADGVARLAASDVTAVLLPTAALVLGRPMPPARALADAGAAIALATDFNPGSSFCPSLPLVASLACTQLGLSPAEALAAMTVNAAHVLGLAGDTGRLRVGATADITVLEAPDWRYLAYRMGHDGVRHVVARGEWAVGF